VACWPFVYFSNFCLQESINWTTITGQCLIPLHLKIGRSNRMLFHQTHGAVSNKMTITPRSKLRGKPSAGPSGERALSTCRPWQLRQFPFILSKRIVRIPIVHRPVKGNGRSRVNSRPHINKTACPLLRSPDLFHSQMATTLLAIKRRVHFTDSHAGHRQHFHNSGNSNNFNRYETTAFNSQ
jgi:hypothetical protein